MPEFLGGCLCEQVRYTGNATPLLTGVCHFRDCQKQTGTSFSIVIAVPQASLTVTGTLQMYATTGVSGGRVRRHFCPRCGSPIFSAADAMPAALFIKAGTLDDPSWLAPQAEMWCETAQPWVHAGTAVPRFPRNPPFE